MTDESTDEPNDLPPPSSPPDFSDTLAPIRATTNLEAVLLVDRTGNPVGVASADTVTPETLDALLALARRVIEQSPDLAALISKDETLFFDWEGRHAVCRVFEASKQPWLLTVLTPRQKPYKQALGKLVKALSSAIKKALPVPAQAKPAKRRSRK